MKIRYYLAMAAAALLMTNCSQDEPLVQEKGSTNTLTATIEGASRSSVTDGGVFSWNEGDAIAVGNKNRTFTTFVSNADGVFSATESIIPTDYAIYPSNIAPQTLPESGNLPTIELPENYDYGSTHAPMLATIGQNATSLQFKHLAGLMRFKVKNVPAGDGSFKLTAESNGITGEFRLEPEKTIKAKTIVNNNNPENVVTIDYEAEDVTEVMDFYVPMPVGTYTSLKIEIGGKVLSSSQSAINVITRSKLLLMPTMVYDATNGLQLESGANKGSSIELENNSEVNLAVASGDNVVVEMDGTEATLNLTAAEPYAELTISDGSASGTASQDSQATLNVSATNVSALNINAPTLTVSLENGNYENVTATTATNTLVIGKGVTVATLKLLGGNLRIVDGGTVNEILDASGNKFTVVKSVEELIGAIDNSKTHIILGDDITSSEIITINKSLTLHGNGYTFTSTAGRAFNLDNGAVNVTIKNLTIDAAERAINIINSSKTVVIENVTATANNNAVMVATSAPNVNLTINDSQLSGLATVNVAGENAEVEINNTEIYCNDNNGKENYGAITIFSTATNASVVMTSGKIVVSDDSKAGYVFPSDATIELNQTEGNTVIGYVNFTIGDAGYEELQEAFDDVKDGQTIIMQRNVNISETVTAKNNKNFTFNLNGKTINVGCADDAIYCTDFKNTGTMTIKNGKIVAANKENARRCIYNYGTMTIEDVEFTQTYTNKGAAINNEGTMTIVNATVNAAYYAIWNSGSGHTLTITNGTFISTSCVENYVGSENPAYAVMNREGAKLVVNAGEFKGIHGCIATHTGADVDINGGTFTAAKTAGQVTGTSHYALWIYNPIPEDAIEVTLDDCTLDASNSTYNVAIYKGSNSSEAAYVGLIINSGVTLKGETKENDDYNGQ